MYSDEKKHIRYDSWTSRKKKDFDFPYYQMKFNELDDCFIEAEEILKKVNKSIYFTSKRSSIDKVLTKVGQLYTYIDDLILDTDSLIDLPLYYNLKNYASDTIAGIKAENITTYNTLGIKCLGETSDRSYKVSIGFEDFMNGNMDGEYIDKFRELFREDYDKMLDSEIFDEESKINNYQDYIDYLIKRGFSDHKKDNILLSFISGVLDITIIKPIIEAIIGEDLITQDELSGIERILKLVGAGLDTYTFAKALTVIKLGASGGSNAFAKTMLVESLINSLKNSGLSEDEIKGIQSILETKWVREPVSINANEIRFSQSSVNGAEEIISSMKANGWKGDPIDVVKMSDGKLTTIDNTRVVAAREAGIDAQVIIHDANELLPENLIDRFTTKKGVPKTWGEAIQLRIAKQKASFRNSNPFGADDMERIC